MSPKPKRDWLATALTVLAVAVGLPIVIGLGVFEYVSATATPLHPAAKDVPSATQSAISPKWADAVDQGRQTVRAGVAEKNLPGVSVAVGVGGDIVWAEGFGWADIENHVSVTPETRFRIGTASTVLTSAAVGLLLEKERLKLDEKIQTYVPEFPEQKWPVTVRQLMGHVAGMRNDGGDEGPLFTMHCARPVEAIDGFKDGKLRFEPGTEYRYSSYGWILLSAAVETAAGRPFFTYMRDEVFKPLGMENTLPDDSTAEEVADPKPIPGRATPYFPRFGGDPKYGPDLMRPLDYSCYAGASGFLSTPSDLVRFVMGVSGGKLLRPDSVKLLQTSQRLTTGPETGYGLGWDLETVSLSGKQTNIVGHDGSVLGGMAASVMAFPEHGIVVSVIANTSYADTASLAVRVAQGFASPRK